MKKLLVFLALAVAGCIDVPTGLNDHIDLITASGEVATVNCVPASLSIAISEKGMCAAFNSDGTRLDIDGFSPVVWVSSDPMAVTITLDGEIYAVSVVSVSVTITGTGTNGTSATFVVASTP